MFQYLNQVLNVTSPQFYTFSYMLQHANHHSLKGVLYNSWDNLHNYIHEINSCAWFQHFLFDQSPYKKSIRNMSGDGRVGGHGSSIVTDKAIRKCFL